MPVRIGVRDDILLVQCRIARLDQQSAAVGHRVARVDAEIDEGGLELRAVDIGDPQVIRENGLDFDLRPQCAAQ
jgi:hypothetical protein